MVDREHKKVLWLAMSVLIILGTFYTCLQIAKKRQEIKMEKLQAEAERIMEDMEDNLRDRKLELLEQVIERYENNYKDTVGRDNGRR